MASDRSIERYRRWYVRLLRLYPRPYRQRFAEPMAQTFTDLCRERGDRHRGLLGFAIATFAETSTAIIRENVMHMRTSANAVIRWGLVAAAVLALPLLAMALRIEGVTWGPLDFAISGALILGAGLLYEFASTRSGRLTAHRAAVGLAVGLGLLLSWVNLAVGLIGDPGNPANLMYLAVLAIALVGAAIARFDPRQASIAMFAAAAAQAGVAVIALVGGLGSTLLADALFVAGWTASGVLFRQASASARSVA